MKLSIGIVGLPNVGKSTLFKILTSQDILIANYPFATIDPNVGIVPVPDERLDALTELSASKKRVPAVVEFYDIAGLVKGANAGEGLGNQFLQCIKETQAIIMVLRIFEDPSIVHVENTVDPLRDLEILTAELALKDLDAVEKRLAKLEGEARTGEKKAVRNMETLNSVKEALNRSESIQEFSEEETVKELNLLMAKKQIYLLNGSEADVPEDLKNKLPAGSYIVEDLASSGDVNDLIKKGYEILDLISFLTTGEDESRAWTVRRGAKAPEAAGAIHTDFENKFIRAEVINWSKLLEAGSWTQAKQKGWLRLEGKEYVVQDGDVMVIRHG